jgi:glycosyltransferase involved in cell wall biosynthesis
MIARNEGWRIEQSLGSVQFADEIIVADNESTDDTAGRAKALGARVLRIPFEGFGLTKQRALDEARGQWVLMLDADEEVTKRLQGEIEDVVRRDDLSVNGYILSRRAWFLGRPMEHGGWGRDEVPRLFRRGAGKMTEDRVHERVIISGPVSRLSGLLEHRTDPTFQGYLAKIDRYSTLAAETLAASGKPANLATGLFHGVSRFFKQYLIKHGYRDGAHGALLALTSGYAVTLRHLKAALIRRGFEHGVIGHRLEAHPRDDMPDE